MNNADFPTENAPDGLLHGWYSKQQEFLVGSILYEKADQTDQNKIQVSEVSKEPKKKQETFDDMRYVGLVKELSISSPIERVSNGRFNSVNNSTL